MVSAELLTSGLEYTHHDQFFNLRIAKERGVVERHLGLVYELRQLVTAPLRVCALTTDVKFCPFVHAMLQHYDLTCVCNVTDAHDVLYLLPGTPLPWALHGTCAYVLAPQEVDLKPRFHSFPLSNSDYVLHVRLDCEPAFCAHFASELQGTTLSFDNLINLCIMVKNAGPLFEQVLQENVKYADRWTILDTGSTDETLDIVNKVLVQSGKRGQLHQEPFINFRDSRNRCLDLAGKACKYNVMLDDTYIVRGDARTFFETVRGDEFASSFSFYIQSGDTEYTTNRVTRSELGLRYKFLIHEVIDDKNNTNVLVPREIAYIDDLRAQYMEERTMARKQYDLSLLLQSVEEEPEEPRHLYYTAQTYSLMNDTENAAKYYKLRADHAGGFHQERVDACFELARTLQFKQNRPWSEVEPVYLRVLELEPMRVDALYFLGVYHIYDGRTDEESAFPWFEKAFALGYPVSTQYSLKPTLVFYFLPQFLAPMCYPRHKWKLGLDAANRVLDNLTNQAVRDVADPRVVEQLVSWRDIYRSLIKLPAVVTPMRTIDVLFVVDGNWSAWTGADIESKGLGGSETWAVEVATHWKQSSPNATIVFLCNCPGVTKYKGVEFVPITHYETLLATHTVATCVVSRFSHYLFAPLHTHCSRIVLYLHDIGPSGNILPMDARLTHVFCLTPWHQQLVQQNYPAHAPRTHSLGYGIDSAMWAPGDKVKHSFIYSSFPDRGLVHLLTMWPRIRDRVPDATLNVFCNLQHDHVRRVNGPMMARIDGLLATPGWCDGVTVHGWVSKAALAAAFARAEYWLYPNIFDETFCLTALEAASSGVVGIAPPKAALQHMPLYFVHGDASTEEWQTAALNAVVGLMTNDGERARLVKDGLEFARERSWRRQTEELQRMLFM